MVDLIVSDDHNQINEDMMTSIKNVIEKTLEMENIDFDVEISLSFVTDDQIRVLNKDFRNIDEATDVLSFPMYEIDEIRRLNLIEQEQYVALGDVVVSYEHAKKQADSFGHSYKREVCYLVCHSILHFLGYDHMNEEEKNIMRAKEEEVLEYFSITR